MPKQISQKQQKLIKFLELLDSNTVFLAHFEAEPTSPTVWECIRAAALHAKLDSPPSKLQDFLRIVNQQPVVSTGRLSLAVNSYQRLAKIASNAARSNKKELASALGLGQDPLPYASLVSQEKLTIVHRDRMDTVHTCHTILVDRGNEDLLHPVNSVQVLAVPADETWYVVQEHESVAFINSSGEIELVVMRGSCIRRPDVISHINEVIMDVVHNRRGVRPNHGGKLIQYGWNAGPRHARIWGLVNNNAKKKLEGSVELAAQDKSILGAISLTWNFLTAVLPKEIIEPVRMEIAQAGLPAMATPDDKQEQGYELVLPGGTLSWSTAERAPAEAYMAQNYTAPIHTDQLYAPYALNWVTMHEVVDADAANFLHGTCVNTGVNTRRSTKLKPQSKFCRTIGGNYVDVSLHVVVKCAKDTAMAVKPRFKHGTTLSRPGVQRQGIAINFSTYIKEAFDKAEQAGGLAVDVTEENDSAK